MKARFSRSHARFFTLASSIRFPFISGLYSRVARRVTPHLALTCHAATHSLHTRAHTHVSVATSTRLSRRCAPLALPTHRPHAPHAPCARCSRVVARLLHLCRHRRRHALDLAELRDKTISASAPQPCACAFQLFHTLTLAVRPVELPQVQ